MIIDPKNIETKDLHQFIVGSIAPRPIAFASTVDESGAPNLAPYSFFNAFSSNPPILVFSSNRRVLNNTTKDTLHNIERTKEVVINMVDYAMVKQMAIASVEFPSDVNEFDKSGLTPVSAQRVKPYLVKESPVSYECKVKEIIALGDHGGAGHLILCEVLTLHVADHVLDGARINPHKLDLVGRMGRAYYVRASGDAIFTLPQPVTKMVIGWDALPISIRRSSILTAQDVSILAACHHIPGPEDIDIFCQSTEGRNFVSTDSVPKQHWHIKLCLNDPQKALLMAFALENRA